MKKIIGYKVKTEYSKVARNLFSLAPADKTGGWGAFSSKSSLKEFYKNAGVLVIWYDTIYQKDFVPGDWITITDVNRELTAGCYGIGVGSFEVVEKDTTYEHRGLSENDPDTIYVLSEKGKRWCISGIFNLATENEIKLAKEKIKIVKAKEKYPIGTIYNSTGGYLKLGISAYSVFAIDNFNHRGDIIIEDARGNYQGTLWSESLQTWADIIKPCPSIKVNGYQGEFLQVSIKFGCAQIGYDTFIALNDCITNDKSGNRSIKSVKIGAGDFTADDIKTIATWALENKK